MMKATKTKNKKRIIIISSIIAGVLLCTAAAVFGIYKCRLDPYRHQVRSIAPTRPTDERLTARQISEDMKFVYDHVSETHPIWVDGSDNTVEEFDSAYKTQCEYLASMGDEATVLDEWRSISALLAVLGDAHTFSNVRPQNERSITTVACDELSDDAMLVAIGGSSVDTLYRKFQTMCSYENEVWALKMFKEAVVREPWLNALGIDTRGDVVFEYSDNREIKRCIYRFEPQEENNENENDNENTPAASEERSDEFCRYNIDIANGVGVFTLDKCIYNDEYTRMLNDFFDDVKYNNIQNIIVDLRQNEGGDSRVANAFLEYLDTDSFISFGGVSVRYGNFYMNNNADLNKVAKRYNTFTGDVYVLTSGQTFSSALDFAVMISDNGLGRIIGEQPGGMPGSYGDIVISQTPNAGVLMQVSYKRFHRIDREKDALPLIPDIECSADEALEKAMEIISE